MKILHTADIHVGYTTHGKLDAETGLNSRLLDFKRAFEFMTRYAVDHQIDLFLFCGDAFRDATPSPTEQNIFSECLKPLCEAQIPVVMLVGNHDHPFAYGKAHALQIYGDLLSNVTLISKPGAYDIQTRSGPIRIIGLPWPVKSNIFSKKEFAELSPEELRDKIHEIYVEFISLKAEELRQTPPGMPVVLAGHLHLDTAMITENSERQTLLTKDPLFSVSSLAKEAFQYVALGHIHKHQDLNEGQLPPVVYSGSPERISFNEWQQPKGFVELDIDERNEVSYRHIQTPARRFVSIEVDVTGVSDPMSAILAECQSREIQDGVVRVKVRCNEAQKSDIVLADIKSALSDAFLITQIQLDVAEKTNRIRQPGFTKTLSVKEALDAFIENDPHMKNNKANVLRLADELMNEFESGQEKT
jgi:exonuclease SbcD